MPDNNERHISESRRRRRVPKSCNYCRFKKLKCDRSRPCCANCIIRNVKDCIYSEDVTKNMNIDRNQQPKISNVHPEIKTGSHNPFISAVYVLNDEKTDSILVLGPTASKTFAFSVHPSFTDKFTQLWKKSKVERDIWKLDHQQKNYNYSNSTSEQYDNTDIEIDELVACLPDEKYLKKTLLNFFERADIFDINCIISKQTTMNNFGIIFGDREDSKAKLEVKKYDTKERFQFGILILIFSIVDMDTFQTPPVITLVEKFCSVINMRRFYLEQAQLLLLRCYYLKLNHGNTLVLLDTVERLVNVSMGLGLHLDPKVILSKYNFDSTNLNLFKNIWYWILYLDLNTAYLFGRPLKISTSFFYDFDEIDHDNFGTSEKAREFLRLCRSIHNNINDRNKNCDVIGDCKLVRTFIMEQFPKLIFNDDLEPQRHPISEIRILSFSLSYLCTLYSLRFKVLNERTNELKNNFIQTILSSFKYFRDLISYSYLQDIKYSPDMCEDRKKGLPPYLSAAISLSEDLYERSMLFFASVVYYRLTLFEKGSFRSEDLKRVEWNIESLEIPGKSPITLLTAYEIYLDIYNEWYKKENETFRALLKRSGTYLLMFTLEKICKIIIENVVEFRAQSENSILDVIDKDIVNINMIEPQNNSFINLNDETLDTRISDEFWTSFNIFWSDLLDKDFNI